MSRNRYEKVKVVLEVEIPIDATHYYGDLFDKPIFFCKNEVDAAQTWFDWNIEKLCWEFYSYKEPYFIKKIDFLSIDKIRKQTIGG